MPRVLSQQDVSDFRERVCETAARLFAEKGPQQVTMRELAAALGVSAMTPYRYFKDKDEILAAVRARAFDRFAEVLENAFAGPGSIVERALAKREAYVRFALTEPIAYHLMFDLSQPSESQYPDLVRAIQRARAQMTSHIQAFVDAGMLKGDPELIGLVFWSVLHGAVTLHLANKLPSQYKLSPQYAIDQILSEAMRVLAEGYRAGVERARE
jgi:AcrR family transcriptional regulator